MLEVLRIGGKLELMPKIKKLNDEEENRPSYSSQIMEIGEDSVVCTMPISEGKLVVIEVGTILEVYFYVGNGIYKADCSVTARGKEGNIYSMTMEPVTELKKFQRREFFRLEITIEVAIKVLNDSEAEYFEKHKSLPEVIAGQEERAIIIDVSGGGLRVFSRTRYEKNSTVNIKFPIVIGGNTKVMNLAGKVIRSLESPNSSQVYDIRIQFKHISRENSEEIIKYIFEQQRLMRKKEMG